MMSGADGRITNRDWRDADRRGIADRPGESGKLHMVVPEHHLVPPLILVAVPRGILGRIKSRVFTNPAALDDLGDGPDGDFRAFDRRAAGLGGDVFDAPRDRWPIACNSCCRIPGNSPWHRN